MANRIIHGFLRDMVEMGGHVYIVDHHRLRAFKPATDIKKVFQLAGTSFERGHQSVGFRDHRQQAARELLRFADGIVDQLYDFCRVIRLRHRVFGEFLLQHFAHESNPGQVLTQSVVKVPADAMLFAFAYS